MGKVTTNFDVSPIMRPAARVLLIDERDRTLLFRFSTGEKEPAEFWITPGGGLHPGETFQQAAHGVLFISQHTVVRHVSNILSKTGSSNRAEAGAYAHRRGLML